MKKHVKLKTEGKNSKLKEKLKTQGKNSNFRHIHMLALRKRWPKNKPDLKQKRREEALPISKRSFPKKFPLWLDTYNLDIAI